MLGRLLVEFLGYWMAEGWLAGGLSGGGWEWLGCWLGWGVHGDSLSRGTHPGVGLVVCLGGQNQHNYQEGITYPFRD